MQLGAANTISLLAVVLLTHRLVSAQDLTQCDPVKLFTPKSLVFLGGVQTVTAGDITFSYHSFGPLTNSPPAADKALILIHGQGGTQYDWPTSMLEALAANRRVIIFDSPRIGSTTDTSNETLTIEYMANATVDFIDALELDAPDVFGYSMGAMVAATIAATQPDKIGSVVAGAGSLGGPKALVPASGLNSTLSRLAELFISKYEDPSSATSASFAWSEGVALRVDAAAASREALTTTVPRLASSSSTNSNGGGNRRMMQTSETGPTVDYFTLFFPLGVNDTGLCELLNMDFSLRYAAGLLSFEGAGYALPSPTFFPDGIIPSVQAIIPTATALRQQVQAILQFFTQPSETRTALATTNKQILFISGSQDTVIPVLNQVDGASVAPGAWLIQISDAGHGVVYSSPEKVAQFVNEFLMSSEDLSADAVKYYQPASSGAFTVGMLSIPLFTGVLVDLLL